MLGEVLDHVVALGFAVDDDIESEALLEVDGTVDLRPHCRFVGLGVDPPRTMVGSGPSHLGGLGERTDRRRRQHRHGDGLLGEGPVGCRAAATVVAGHRGHARGHGRVVDPGGFAARAQRPVGPGERRRAGLRAVTEGGGQCFDLGDLLLGEGEPPGDVDGEIRLVGDRVGDVEQGRRRRDAHLIPTQPGEDVEGRGEVVGPDVATVDDSGDEADRRGHLGGDPVEPGGIEAAGGRGDVDPEGGDPGVRECRQTRLERTVRGGDEKFRVRECRGQRAVDPGGRLGEFVIA